MRVEGEVLMPKPRFIGSLWVLGFQGRDLLGTLSERKTLYGWG